MKLALELRDSISGPCRRDSESSSGRMLCFAKLGRINGREHKNEANNLKADEKLVLFVSISIMIIALTNSVSVTEAVDCFKCTSRNGTNPACEDPFHNLNTTRVTSSLVPDPPPPVIYHTPCYAGKKGKMGLFPASACIKLIGTYENTGERLVVRHCALDSGTLTQDTELARMSHCGKFMMDGEFLKGCVMACPDDACNSSQSSISIMKKMPLAFFTSALLLLCLASSKLIAYTETIHFV